jgi:hypothetical protein
MLSVPSLEDLEMLLPKAGSREEVYRAAALLQPEFQVQLWPSAAAALLLCPGLPAAADGRQHV